MEILGSEKIKAYASVKYRNVFIFSVCLFIFSVGFGVFLFPRLLNKLIKSQIHVAPGSALRPVYIKAPIFADFRIYLFNVTNKEEVIQGEKPKLKEIGPYFFEEWKEKFDLHDNEEEDTLVYHGRNVFKFRPDLSGHGLSGNEIIVMPHPLAMGMFMSVNIDKKPFLPTVENAINNLFHNPADAFYTGKAMDLLFNGVEVDCSSDDAATVAICLQFEDASAFKQIDEKLLAFSLFAGINDTDMGEFKVYRGKKNYKDLGRLISFNGDTESGAWDEDECNKFSGTDTTIFPPLVTKKDAITGYDPSVCRPLSMTYRSKSIYNGVPVLIFEADLSEAINVKPCYCRDEDTCPPKGTFDMFHCTGVPMFGSLPHFYMAEQLLNGVESGLNPNKKDHGISVSMEPLTGAPLQAYKRLQFSLEVKPIPEIEMLKNIPELYFPLFWVEEGVSLGRDMTDPIKDTLYLSVDVVNVIKWFGGVFGFIGSALSAAMLLINGFDSSFELE